MTHIKAQKAMPCNLFSVLIPSMRRSHLMSAPMSSDRIKSMIPRKPAMMKTATITTSVEPMTSRRLGHVTFFVSAWTSCKKVVIRATYSRMAPGSPVNVEDLNHHGHVRKAGQEGFEPPTPGFGVRCSSRSSYTPPSLVGGGATGPLRSRPPHGAREQTTREGCKRFEERSGNPLALIIALTLINGMITFSFYINCQRLS